MSGLRRTGKVLTQTIRKAYSAVFAVDSINIIGLCVCLFACVGIILGKVDTKILSLSLSLSNQ